VEIDQVVATSDRRRHLGDGLPDWKRGKSSDWSGQ